MPARPTPEVNTPEQQLDTAWVNRNNARYDLERQMSEQSMEIAAAIAAGAPASLEQLVYASFGAHPNWRKVYEQIAAINEQLQSNVPLALFSEGDMEYFGYPERFGTWSRYGNTGRDHLAFNYSFETSQQRDTKLAELSLIFGKTATEETVTHYHSTLSLPMRILYDFEPGGLRGDPKKAENASLKNVFSSSVSAIYRSPRSDAEYRFDMTTADDKEPGDKLVVASGMHNIVKLASKSLTDVNLRRLKFALSHEERDFDAGAD